MFSRLMLRDLVDPLDYRYSVTPSLFDDYYVTPPHIHLNVVRPRRQASSGSAGKADSKSDPSKFQVMLNVKHFRPDEIDVKTVDNFVVIHGKHEEHADEHGFVSREFTRRYQLPDDVEPDTITSSLSQDGVLTIQAPRKALEPPPKNERVVPITLQQPAAVEDMKKQQEQQQAAATAAASSAEENK
ncbi:Protein lethal(2)essential for life, partial [Stegodyphus mimosarum]